MTTGQKLAFALTIALSIALPLLVQRHMRARLRETDRASQKLAERSQHLETENQRLSNSVAQANAESLSADQLQELLRLRGELGRLREQTSAIQKLSDENQRLQANAGASQPQTAPMSEQELNDKLAAETVQTMKNIFTELPSALQKYASEHNGEYPHDFPQLRKYFPSANGNRMPGLYTFEFIRDGGPLPGDALILRETGIRWRPDKTKSRAYAFSDGRVVEQTVSDDGEFDAWEKQNLVQSAANP